MNNSFSQGSLLNTKQTMRWSRELRETAMIEEKRKVFFGFSSLDQGRSRVLICNTPNSECAKTIAASLNALIHLLEGNTFEPIAISDLKNRLNGLTNGGLFNDVKRN